MADQLYLSLWFPNFRLEALPAALTSVMRQFALVSDTAKTTGAKRVTAASVYPISFSEAPTYQRLYVNSNRSEDNSDSIIENAVAEATEQLHDDMAYEFEMRWNLWTPDSGPGSPNYTAEDSAADPADRLDTLWKPLPATVKIIGFGPAFDEGDFQQNGHVRVDFGLDYPWVLDDREETSSDDDEHDGDRSDDGDEHARNRSNDDDEPDGDQTNVLAFRASAPKSADPAIPEAAQYIQRNVEMLLAFTLSVEKHCGISSRLLWTESGEPLAEKLIGSLQRLN